MRRLIGLAACLGIVAVVAGVPVVLLHIGANPVPTGVSWTEVWARLTSPDDGTLIRALFSLLAWAAWVYFTLAILVEVVSRARRIRAPRLPGFRPSQLAAQSLVGAAALLFTAAPLAAHAQPPVPVVSARSHATHHAQPENTPRLDRQARPAPAGSHGTGSDQATKKSGTTTHTVRRGESLSTIAQHELGNAHRWTEIAKLNYGRVQDDGHALTHDHVIQPGWKLRLPTHHHPNKADTHAKTHRVQRGESLWSIAEDNLGEGDRYPEIVRASRTIEQPGGVRITDPDVIEPGWIVRIPGQAAKTHHSPHPKPRSTPRPPSAAPIPPPRQPAPPASSTTAPATPSASATPTASVPTTSQPPTQTSTNRAGDTSQPGSASEDDGLDAPLPVATAAGVGTVLAAGVIGLVAYRRRQQQRRRRPGRRLPMPTADVAHTEQQLRAAADPLSVETVDAALRGLARSCADTQQPLPTVRAARLTGAQFDLYLDQPTTLPAPWTGTADATVWTLLADHADQVDTNLSGIPAPFPALVTIGHDLDDGHVFLDLEYLTSLGLAGSPELAAQVLAALAIELATSHWADDLQVTIVGAYPELEDALQTGRIRYLPSVGRVLDDLATRAADDRAALADAGVPDLNHARTTRQAPDAWTPEIVLIAGTLTERQRTQLDQLADATPRVAIATITSDDPVAEWALVLDDSGDTAVLEPIGLTLRPQRIDPDSYAHILELVATATDDQDVPDPALVDEQPIDEQTTMTAAEASPAASDAPAATPAGMGGDDHEEALTSTAHVRAAESQLEDTPSESSQDGSTTQAAGRATTELGPTDQTPPTETVATLPSDSTDAPQPAAITTSELPSPSPTTAPTDEPDGRPEADVDDLETAVRPMTARKPRICVLGPVSIENAAGTVEPSKKTRLLEYAAYLALNATATPAAIDDAIWPSRATEDNLNTRNTATSKLRAWIGRDISGEFYLPRFSYAFADGVSTDWDQWQQLVGPDPARATTAHLEQALSLVRGRPFEGTQLRRYAWAEPLKQEMISAIADVAYELAHRRLMDGRWRAADEAAARALSIEPGLERLWRIRILAAHEAHNPAAESEAIDRMLLTIDELGFDLEPETTELLEALRDNTEPHLDKLLSKAL